MVLASPSDKFRYYPQCLPRAVSDTAPLNKYRRAHREGPWGHQQLLWDLFFEVSQQWKEIKLLQTHTALLLETLEFGFGVGTAFLFRAFKGWNRSQLWHLVHPDTHQYFRDQKGTACDSKQGWIQSSAFLLSPRQIANNYPFLLNTEWQ